VGILSGGRTLFEGTIHQLREAVTGRVTVEVTVEDAGSVAPLLAPEYSVSIGDGRTLLVALGSEGEAPGLIRCLVERGIRTYAVTPRKSDLEQLFLQLTGAPGEDGRT
jgi:ABC-type multidrug transport system ATPase subunit